MKYGFIIPRGDVHTIPELAERVEAAGWDAVFIPDSISIETEQHPATDGFDPNWTHYHRLLSGVKTIDEDTFSIDTRGNLALHLYRETATLLLPTLSEQHSTVVEQVLTLIEQAF